jgi:hypothetical protein
MVGKFVSRNRKKITLKRAFAIVIRQTIQEANKGILNDIFCMRTINKTSADKGEKAPFETIDKLLPSVGTTRTNAID